MIVGSTIRKLWLYLQDPIKFDLRDPSIDRLFLLRSDPNHDLDVVLPEKDKLKFASIRRGITDDRIYYCLEYKFDVTLEFIFLPLSSDPQILDLPPYIKWCLEAPFPVDTFSATPNPDGSLVLYNPLNIPPTQHPKKYSPFPHATDPNSHSPFRIARCMAKAAFSASGGHNQVKIPDALSTYELTLNPSLAQAFSMWTLLNKLINTPSTTYEDALAALNLASHGVLHTFAAAVLTLSDYNHPAADKAVRAMNYLLKSLFTHGSTNTPWHLMPRLSHPADLKPHSKYLVKLLDCNPGLWQHDPGSLVSPYST